ncbi:MAG: tetratricopeptide repeat protein, partial [Rhodospirillales bacterium]|nr:tetratricopeptide repeat protein [Rhodospirillales bacterium]
MAVELVRWAHGWLKWWGKAVWVVADGAYAKAPVLKALRALAVTVVSRLRKDAALWTVPGARDPKRRGRPRVYGEHRVSLPKPAGQARGWTTGTFTLYGKAVEKRYKTFCATWRPAGGAIRVVLVDEPKGWVAFFCTDTTATVADILGLVADRFSLETAFRDLKQVVGAGQQQVRGLASNVGCFHLCAWAFTMTEAWAWDQKAEALAPTDVGLQTRLASLRLGIGQAETAMDDLEHTLQLAPKMPMVAEALFFASVATGDLSKATDALAKIKAAQGDTEVTENLTGLYQLAQIDLDGARDTFAAVVRKYPDFAAARVNLARVTAMLGDRKDAEQMLADLLARQPAAEPALAMLVATYTQAGRLPDAVALLERARAAEPQNTRLIASLGDLYIRSGAPEKALDLALAQKDRLARSTDVLAMKASAQLARGQKKEARDTYGALLTTDPNLLGARRQLANLLIDASDFQSARNVVLAGIAASPRTYQLYQDLALIDLKANGLDDALATADRLIAQDRDFATLRGLKGDIYLAAKRPEDAITAYRQALASTPDTSLVTRLAGAQLRAHRPDDAQATLRSWLDTHPDDTMVLQ